MHSSLFIQDLGVTFGPKVCFESFSQEIPYGSRIAVIGRNGSGKSSLLKILALEQDPAFGTIRLPEGATVGYVPQLIETPIHLSGAQRFQSTLSKTLGQQPDILLLDEPTNHLDADNRRSLMRMLQHYAGTLIVVSHDVELIRECIDTLWCIEEQSICVFTGTYDAFLEERRIRRQNLESKLSRLKSQKKSTHAALMQEQQRAKKSREQGKKKTQNNHWSTIAAGTKKRQAQSTAGHKQKALRQERQDLTQTLEDIHIPEVILPSFALSPASGKGSKEILSIRNGSIAYASAPKTYIRTGIHLSLFLGERLAIGGKNGSGKSTLLKAICRHPDILREGSWSMPAPQDIGYLDQHYALLDPQKTILQSLYSQVPTWSHNDLRKHLSTFLFRDNVESLTQVLSGGERVRLCLALIAAKPPKLFILDEVTNNLDLETRQHLLDVLTPYPGSLLLVDHDADFVQKLTTR